MATKVSTSLFPFLWPEQLSVILNCELRAMSTWPPTGRDHPPGGQG